MSYPKPNPVVPATRPLGPLIFTRLSSGIKIASSLEPIVALYPTQYINTYHLCIVVYIPEGGSPVMDEDFSDIVLKNTEAGNNIPTRQLKIRYTEHPFSTYNLWSMEVDYVVAGPVANAIRVYFEVEKLIENPIASRGTITTVSNT